jgi:hypothetical protein
MALALALSLPISSSAPCPAANGRRVLKFRIDGNAWRMADDGRRRLRASVSYAPPSRAGAEVSEEARVSQQHDQWGGIKPDAASDNKQMTGHVVRTHGDRADAPMGCRWWPGLSVRLGLGCVCPALIAPPGEWGQPTTVNSARSTHPLPCVLTRAHVSLVERRSREYTDRDELARLLIASSQLPHYNFFRPGRTIWPTIGW